MWRTKAIAKPGDLDAWWSEHSVKGERLVLRPIRAVDYDAFLRTIDDEVLLWQGWRSAAGTFPRKEAEPAKRAEEGLRVLQRVPIACPLRFAVLDEDDALIGSVSFTNSETPALGWWLGPQGRGRRLSVEMLAPRWTTPTST